MIEDFVKEIPGSLLDRSGSVFLSGRCAFNSQSDLYLLGLNPGGNPNDSSSLTIRKDIDNVLHHRREDWCAFCDERWKKSGDGKNAMQRGPLYLFKEVGRNPRCVPASELIFPRSIKFKLLTNPNALADKCWPFHQAVIERLGARVIVCLGRETGWRVRKYLCAQMKVCEFVEDNNRRWKSYLHKNQDGLFVADLTHPSQAKWSAKKTDPTSLVTMALDEIKAERCLSRS